MHFKKRFYDLTEQEVVLIHLAGAECSTSDCRVLSSLARIEIEARHAINYDKSKVFLPLLAAFAILDQVGGCYRDSSKAQVLNEKASGVKKALYYFFGFGDNDDSVKTLYALRNGVLHDASLISHAANGVDHYWFRFDTEMEEIVKVAPEPWSGDFKDWSDKNLSLVNPVALINHISDMLTHLNRLNEAGNLELVLPGGCTELCARFLYTVPY
jgi:hypothetical protein